jgi:hypothetical protein
VWGGFSGAAVVHIDDDVVLGVVSSHNRAAGVGSLSVTPVAAIDGLPEQTRTRFLEALGAGEAAGWLLLPDAGAAEYRRLLTGSTRAGRPPQDS